jgi:hypothetical protein
MKVPQISTGIVQSITQLSNRMILNILNDYTPQFLFEVWNKKVIRMINAFRKESRADGSFASSKTVTKL